MSEHVYHHGCLNKEIVAIGGSYVLTREERVMFKGLDLLYLVGYGLFDTSCCGAGGCSYALVQGNVIQWKAEKDKDLNWMSIIEPVMDDILRKRITEFIKKKEKVIQVVFK